MSLITKHASIQQLVGLYQTYIVPHLTKRNKKMGLSVAAALSLLYLIHDKVFKPPKRLRHIPYHTYYTFIGSILRKESLTDFYAREIIPAIDSRENDGIHVRPFNLAWNVMVSNPVHAKKVLLNTDIFPKAQANRLISETLFGRFVIGPNMASVNGAAWKSQRKLANPVFHRAMPVGLFGDLTLELFDVIDQNGPVLSFTDLAERWTLESIGKAGFGFNFNAISKKHNEWVDTYNVINAGIGNPLHFIFPFLDRQNSVWLSSKRRALHTELDRFLEMLDQIILRKREAIARGDLENDYLPENEKDLLTLLIEGEMRGEGVMSNEELKSNVCLFFLAGHETTSNALSFAMYRLAVNPDIQQRAREEAIRILGDGPEDVLPTLDQVRQMDYLNQVIKEVLRINSPVNRVIPRLSTEDFYLGDTFIPKGSLVSVDLTAIHHSKKVWNNPEKFDPERFAEGGEASQQDAGSGMGWLPFSIGGRQCVGLKFSLYQQRVLLSMLLRKYTWKLPENSIHKHGLIEQGTFTLGPVDLHLEFTKRY